MWRGGRYGDGWLAERKQYNSADAVACTVPLSIIVAAMEKLLVCQKKQKQYKIDRAADDVNVIHCHVMNGKIISIAIA